MTTVLLKELADDRAAFKPLTVAQYHRMLQSGDLMEGDPFELIQGLIVLKDRSAAGEDPMTINPDHALAVKKLSRLAAKLKRLNCHIQTQQPLTLPPHDEPEPDGAIVRAVEEDYRGRHPGAKDVTCVIEVADASLNWDRTKKQLVYSEVGIPQYVIVNLQEKVVEVYTEPLKASGRYGRTETFKPRQRVKLSAGSGKSLSVSARDLLP